MTVKVRNLARRPVSIACNSGEYRHIPSSGFLDLPDVEIKDNPMVDKLVKRRVLAIGDGALKKASEGKSGRTVKPKKSKAES